MAHEATTVEFGDFEANCHLPTSSHEDLRVLMRALENDAERPSQLLTAPERIRVYQEFGLGWIRRVADGTQGVRSTGTHAYEVRTWCPRALDGAVAAIEALGPRPQGAGIGWSFIPAILAAEAAHALIAVWHASRNVRGSEPLHLSDIEEVIDRITFRR